MLPYSWSVIAILGFNVKFFSQFESDFNQVLRISWVRNLLVRLILWNKEKTDLIAANQFDGEEFLQLALRRARDKIRPPRSLEGFQLFFLTIRVTFLFLADLMSHHILSARKDFCMTLELRTPITITLFYLSKEFFGKTKYKLNFHFISILRCKWPNFTGLEELLSVRVSRQNFKLFFEYICVVSERCIAVQCIMVCRHHHTELARHSGLKPLMSRQRGCFRQLLARKHELDSIQLIFDTSIPYNKQTKK